MLDLLKKYNVEIDKTDFEVEKLLMSVYDIKVIYEHGCGPAGWCISHNAESTQDIFFYINDDFSYAELGLIDNYTKEGIFWPKDKEELEKYLSTIDHPINYKYVDKFPNTVNIDLVRIDGAEDNYRPLLDKVLVNTKFIIADDINPNAGGIERFLTLQEYAAKGLVKFLWAGNKSGLWINTKFNIDTNIFTKAIENSGITHRYKSYNVFGIQQEHISTK